MNDNQILIGEITGVHGVKGLVKIRVCVDNPDLFATVQNPKITLKNKHKGDIWLAAIEGITDRNQAEAMKGHKIFCDRAALPDLEADEIYFTDLVGMGCVDEDGQLIGEVIAFHNFGAGDILEIKPAKGSSFYLSYDDQTVLAIEDQIVIRLPEVI